MILWQPYRHARKLKDLSLLVPMRSIFGVQWLDTAFSRRWNRPPVSVSASVRAWESNYAWDGGSAAGESGVKPPALQSGAATAVNTHNNLNYNA